MGSLVSAPVLTPNVKYDALRDFAPIGVTAHGPAVITARKDFPAKDLREFVAYLKKNGDRVKQAHGGIGSSSHMACLLFTTGIEATPTLVPYRGVDQAVTNLAGGQVDFFCDAAVSAAQHISAGTLKGYAVSSTDRLAILPDVPTARESEVNYQMSIWAGMFAPGGTPRDIVEKLAGALDRALDEPAISKRLGELGGTVPPKAERTPAHFTAFVQTEVARWSPILKAAKDASN
jgi:tripartite-type tricarboxylate transporter receptor subunit TctC